MINIEIKPKTVDITIGSHKFQLTEEEARDLKNKLQQYFGDECFSTPNQHPVYIPTVFPSPNFPPAPGTYLPWVTWYSKSNVYI